MAGIRGPRCWRARASSSEDATHASARNHEGDLQFNAYDQQLDVAVCKLNMEALITRIRDKGVTQRMMLERMKTVLNNPFEWDKAIVQAEIEKHGYFTC